MAKCRLQYLMLIGLFFQQAKLHGEGRDYASHNNFQKLPKSIYTTTGYQVAGTDYSPLPCKFKARWTTALNDGKNKKCKNRPGAVATTIN